MIHVGNAAPSDYRAVYVMALEQLATGLHATSDHYVTTAVRLAA